MPDRVLWRGDIPSGSSNKNYPVTLFVDGTATCECVGYIIRGKNNPALTDDQKLRYRCTHIMRAARQNAPGWLANGKTTTVTKPGYKPEQPAPAVPAPAPSLGIDLSDLDDRSSRWDE